MAVDSDGNKIGADENEGKRRSGLGSTRINILVENLAGKIYEVCISRFKSVLDLKEKIYKYEDVSVDSQNLIYNGAVMSNNSTLFDHDIDEGSVIRLVINMNCGPFGYSSFVPEQENHHNIDRMLLMMFGDDRKKSSRVNFPKIIEQGEKQERHKDTKSRRCFLCRRKLGVLGEYSCRCGRNFCSYHRHAESHDCPYDYKTAAKRELAKKNPLVGGIRLPRI